MSSCGTGTGRARLPRLIEADVRLARWLLAASLFLCAAQGWMHRRMHGWAGGWMWIGEVSDNDNDIISPYVLALCGVMMGRKLIMLGFLAIFARPLDLTISCALSLA